jgi:hypothetical protein
MQHTPQNSQDGIMVRAPYQKRQYGKDSQAADYGLKRIFFTKIGINKIEHVTGYKILSSDIDRKRFKKHRCLRLMNSKKGHT